MLIEKATKYFILDVCLNVFFKSIGENLKTYSADDLPKINDFYSRIAAKNGTETFYNCRILEVLSFDEDGGPSTIIVDFEYDEYVFTGEYDEDDDDLEEDENSPQSAEAILEEADQTPEDEDDDDPSALSDFDDIGIDCVEFKEYLFIR